MKLHVTLTSPYARITRSALIEHALQTQIDVIPARTREANSPYYQLIPSGRVPALELADGRVFEESHLICAYFDQIGAGPALVHPLNHADWEYGRLSSLASTYIDSVGVWGRETRRPRADQSDTILSHEQARAERLVQAWEHEISHPLMTGDLNFVHLMLYCALDVSDYYGRDPTPNHPNLRNWRARLATRASLQATKPPPGGPKPI